MDRVDLSSKPDESAQAITEDYRAAEPVTAADGDADRSSPRSDHDVFLAQQRHLLDRLMNQILFLFPRTQDYIRRHSPLEADAVGRDFWDLWTSLGRLKMTLLPRTSLA